MDSQESKAQATILLVDDNALQLKSLIPLLGTLDARLSVTRDGERALQLAEELKPAVILLDVMMPSPDGFEVCRRLKASPETADSAVLFLTSLDQTEEKLKGFALGAVDFITKPFHAEEVRARVQTQLHLYQLKQDIQRQNRLLAQELSLAQALLHEAKQQVEGPLLGDSPAVEALRVSITRCANNDLPTILLGAHGCGYESIARTLHQESSRGHRAFFYINCAMMRSGQETFLPQEPATTQPIVSQNKFALAHGGTLLLDQIQELPLPHQHTLCEYIARSAHLRQQGQSFYPDIRLITAGSQKLHELARQGKLVTRLLPYLMQQQIQVPSLKDRRADLEQLANFYLNQRARQLGKVELRLTPQSLEYLNRYDWPGNLIELKMLMERFAVIARSAEVTIPEDAIGEGPLLGGYHLVKLLSTGGMGEVWQAKHQLLARPAALKLIRQGSIEHERKREVMLTRFHREARATAGLQSPHTVTLYDFGIDEQGNFYYVMELLHGIDLLDLCKQYGPIQPERLVHLLKGICRSLEEAHNKGLIHRDLKPANIYVAQQGVEYDYPKVLDFGVVKYENETTTELSSLQLQTNQVIGTPGYIAPETYADKEQIDHRVDIYSLGCLAYFSLTGREVFPRGNLMQIAYAHMQEIPSPPSKHSPYAISPAFEQLILDCLQKKPAERPDDIATIWERLDNLPESNQWTPARAKSWWQTRATQEEELS